MGELNFAYVISSIVTAVPMFLVTVAGLVFVAVRVRVLPRAAPLTPFA